MFARLFIPFSRCFACYLREAFSASFHFHSILTSGMESGKSVVAFPVDDAFDGDFSVGEHSSEEITGGGLGRRCCRRRFRPTNSNANRDTAA